MDHNDQRPAPPDQPIPPLSAEDELARYREDLVTILAEVRRLLSHRDEESLNRRPAPDQWSPGECIDHLVVVGGLLLPRLESAIKEGRRAGVTGNGPFHYSWPGRMFADSLRPESRLRMRTVRLYVPGERHSPAELLRRFEEMQERMIRSTEESRGLDLVRIKVASPANRLLRFSLGIWFAATAAHERRHCAQAARATSGVR
jgi:hypothetical protein